MQPPVSPFGATKSRGQSYITFLVVLLNPYHPKLSCLDTRPWEGFTIQGGLYMICTTLTRHCHQTNLWIPLFSIWPLIIHLFPYSPQECRMQLSPLMLGWGDIWACALCAQLWVVIVMKQIDRFSYFHNLTRCYPPWPPDKCHVWLSPLIGPADLFGRVHYVHHSELSSSSNK